MAALRYPGRRQQRPQPAPDANRASAGLPLWLARIAKNRPPGGSPAPQLQRARLQRSTLQRAQLQRAAPERAQLQRTAPKRARSTEQRWRQRAARKFRRRQSRQPPLNSFFFQLG